MRAYRIGSGAHPVFDGTGAALFGGRWNALNQRVIYGGGSFAIAMLERLCYTALGRVPAGDRFIEIDIPDSMSRFSTNALIRAGMSLDPRSPSPTARRGGVSNGPRSCRCLRH